MAVENFKALGADQLLQSAQIVQQVVSGEDDGMNTQLPRLLGEGAFHEADHGNVNPLGEVLEQGVNVGFGAAAVAAGNQVKDFHERNLQKRLVEHGVSVVQYGEMVSCVPLYQERHEFTTVEAKDDRRKRKIVW